MDMKQVKTYEPADIVIYIHNKGIVLREKSLVAANWKTEKIEAVGIEAENMETKNLEGIYVVSPLRQGMIADYQMAVVLFSRLLLKALGKKPLRKPAIGICVPKGITEVEKKAVEDALIQSGAREVFIADIPGEEFVSEFIEKSPKLASKFKIIISITKDEPERYIAEEFGQILQYARQEGISDERVEEVWRKCCQK